jgi:phosphoribosylglycinamide formyltransferase 2
VLFSELSPRPHDTGLVTLVSQRLSQFDLHLRAILGLPVPEVTVQRPGASAAVRADRAVECPAYTGVPDAVGVPETDLRLFGKPDAYPDRRMGVAVATAEDTDTARERARTAADHVTVHDDA